MFSLFPVDEGIRTALSREGVVRETGEGIVVANLSILSQLENYLSLTNQRETVIASNVANSSTTWKQ